MSPLFVMAFFMAGNFLMITWRKEVEDLRKIGKFAGFKSSPGDMKPTKYLAIALMALCMLSFSSCNCCNKDEKARYIFLFIGDGMGCQNVAVTESYLSYKAGKLGGEQLTFTQFPCYGMANTYSADKAITCSSASGTAISTGAKTNNTFIGVDPEGNKLKSISYELQEMGYNIGIMSSVPVNHATPAAFYTTSGLRYSYYDITKTLPESGFKFLAGSGFIDYFGKDGKQQSSAEYVEQNGYKVCFGQEEFEKAGKDERIVLCQPYNKDCEPGNYDIGGPTPDGHIRLKTVLEDGISFLGEEKPFFIMCEGGDIDWAAHANMTMPTVMSMLEFDEAVAVAVDFYRKHPDETLIIVTADHETGGASLGCGYDYREDLDWAYIDSVYTASGMTCKLDTKQNKALNDKANIGWTSSNHTGGPVPVYAIGKGAERFCGRMDNTQIKGKIMAEEPVKK